MSNRKQCALWAGVAFAALIALVWWMAWAVEFLRGWSAFPLGLTVGLLILGAYIASAAMAARAHIRNI